MLWKLPPRGPCFRKIYHRLEEKKKLVEPLAKKGLDFEGRLKTAAKVFAAANKNLENIKAEITTHATVNQNNDDSIEYLTFLDEQAHFMKDVLQHIQNCKPDEKPYATMPVEQIRRNLNAQTWEDIEKKKVEDLLLSLRILDVFGYVNNSFFQGMFQIGLPSVCVAQFHDLHGKVPEIKTGKPSSYAADSLNGFIKLRLAHYLGLVPDTAVTTGTTTAAGTGTTMATTMTTGTGAATNPGSTMDKEAIVHKLKAKSGQDLSNEELKQLLATMKK